MTILFDADKIGADEMSDAANFNIKANIDFSKFSLVLKDEHDKIIFSSINSGLRPLIQCILEVKEKNIKKNSEKHSETVHAFILHDKVIGLAAARLVVYFGCVKKIITPLISKPALNFLKENKIDVEYEQCVENILNKDKTSTCPMEQRAQKAHNNEAFFNELKELMRM